jgi:SlyX protein
MPETAETARLQELETRNAYQEAAIEDLSTRVYEQQQQIDSLERQLFSLAEKVKSIAAGENSPLPENERPPHY